MRLIYCYDAYCGWCYGFSLVIKEIAQEYKHSLPIEVLSGGMIIRDDPPHISSMSQYIKGAYKRVEELSGIKFGEDYLWHIANPDKSDWFLNSEKPAIALSIFKEIHEGRQMEFAADMQFALHFEGRDLTDDEAYQHLLLKYSIDPNLFYTRLHSEEYKEKAHYEFALVKQLKVTGFPCLLLQVTETKFYLISRGYTDKEVVKQTIEDILREVTPSRTGDASRK